VKTALQRKRSRQGNYGGLVRNVLVVLGALLVLGVLALRFASVESAAPVLQPSAEIERVIATKNRAHLVQPRRDDTLREAAPAAPSVASESSLERPELERQLREARAEIARLRGQLGQQEEQQLQLAARNAERWTAAKVIGPPDADAANDDPRAWASARPDMGLQWIEVGYHTPQHGNLLRIFEVNIPGAIVRVTAIEPNGTEHVLWSGVDPTSIPGVFEVSFRTTEYKIKSVRITLDTDQREGWSEIDAVELIGPERRAWSSSARASSHFGQG
jgi:hypothetical protein